MKVCQLQKSFFKTSVRQVSHDVIFSKHVRQSDLVAVSVRIIGLASKSLSNYFQEPSATWIAAAMEVIQMKKTWVLQPNNLRETAADP